jgi:hypothetical protein
VTRVWRELRPFTWVAIVVALYLIVRGIFAAVADGHGVLTPGGAVSGTLAALAVATFALRFAVLVVVPFVVVYRLVMRALRRWVRGKRPGSDAW